MNKLEFLTGLKGTLLHSSLAMTLLIALEITIKSHFPENGVVWSIRVYSQGPRKGTLSNLAHIVPPTRI